MNALAVEILQKIFFHLSQQDKVECMLVCRQWEQVIKVTCLFDTVRISSSSGLRRLVEKIKEEPSRGTKVDRLIFDLKRDSYVNMTDTDKLLPLLPNLRYFLVLSSDTQVTFPRGSYYSFRKKIELASGLSDPGLASLLLNSGICPHLITLTFRYTSRDTFALLKNAPNLKTLKIYHGRINLGDFEFLHENTPSLTSISTHSVQFSCTALPHDINPAPLITNCTFSSSGLHFNQMQSNLFQYISKKYPNLTHFGYEPFFMFGLGLDESWNRLLNTWKLQLRSLSIRGDYNPDYLYCFLTDDGWKINRLKFNCTQYPFDMFRDERVLPNNLRYITSLTLLHVAADNFEALKEFVSLKKLKLFFYLHLERTLKLCDILDFCPETLESLSLGCVDIDSEFHQDSVFAIQHLSFHQVDLPVNMDTFIAHCFPRLTTLKFKDMRLEGKSFLLKNTNLQRFQFEFTNLRDFDSVRVTTIQDNQTRRYTLKNLGCNLPRYPPKTSVFDAPLFPSVKCVPDNENEITPYFSLICNTVKHVVLKPAKSNGFQII